ncbi:MAG: hypothetical protein ACRC92_20260 [Peptostreptococcaceae bacterium]
MDLVNKIKNFKEIYKKPIPPSADEKEVYIMTKSNYDRLIKNLFNRLFPFESEFRSFVKNHPFGSKNPRLIVAENYKSKLSVHDRKELLDKKPGATVKLQIAVAYINLTRGEFYIDGIWYDPYNYAEMLNINVKSMEKYFKEATDFCKKYFTNKVFNSCGMEVKAYTDWNKYESLIFIEVKKEVFIER